jgi:2,3-bisphosphoglycerate-independent phosphoglycerate mutase
VWGGGKSPQITTFKEKFNVSGGVISAVDVVRGIAKYAGLDVINVPGATGYYDTNYMAKGECALKVLSKKDFCVVHIEATDEAGHNGDINEKVKAIEQIDEKILGPILNALKDKEYRIMVVPDHPTFISTRTHSFDAVPFVIYSTSIPFNVEYKNDDVTSFNENSAERSNLKFEKGKDLLELFIGNKQ